MKSKEGGQKATIQSLDFPIQKTNLRGFGDRRCDEWERVQAIWLSREEKLNRKGRKSKDHLRPGEG